MLQYRQRKVKRQMNLVELLAPEGAEIYKVKKKHDRKLSITEYGITYRNMPCYQIRMNSPIACLQYVRYGSGIIISGDRMYRVEMGDTFLLREGIDQIYYSNPDNQFERIWINFKGEFADMLLKLYGIENVILFKDTDTDKLLRDMFELCGSELERESYQSAIEGKLLEIIQLLAKNKKAAPKADTNADRIRMYIDRNITENISLSDIAKEFSFSREYIVRMFKKNYGITPHQYILQSKIRISMIMLKGEDSSIEEISNKLNFSAPEHFSQTFYKYTGYRPSAYKKK